MPENIEWVWIFDSCEFTIKHAMQTNVAIKLAKLISNKFSRNLKKNNNNKSHFLCYANS